MTGKEASDVPGDAHVIARHSSGLEFSLPISIVKPAKIARPYDTIGFGGKTAVNNLALNQGTFPPNFRVPEGDVQLVTLYSRDLKVYVVDQFDEPIGDIYKGAKIVEVLQGPLMGSDLFVDINETLTADSWYMDQVGNTMGRLIVRESDPLALAWFSEPPIPLPAGLKPTTHSLGVEVGGFRLDPGIESRTIVPKPPSDVEIIWP